MGELARYRRDRDLHLSRGHLSAAIVGVVLISTTAFFLGFRMGNTRPVVPVATHFTAEAPREGLVELLARVEASGDTTGGVEALTFPDALTQSSGGGLLDVEPMPSGRFQIEVARYADVADARALREHLRAAEVQAWVGAELEAGMMTWRVVAGGFTGSEEADERLAEVRTALEGWAGAQVSPRVVGH